MSYNGRRLDEFDESSTLNGDEYLLGYRSSAKGTRISKVNLEAWLIALGGGLGTGSTVNSVLMECADDGTKHRLTLLMVDGVYVLSVDQEAEAAASIDSINLRCPDDGSVHALEIKKFGGTYVVTVDQDPI